MYPQESTSHAGVLLDQGENWVPRTGVTGSCGWPAWMPEVELGHPQVLQALFILSKLVSQGVLGAQADIR